VAKGCRDELLSLGNMCVAVVCCRVSPAQKGQMVNLVKVGVPESRCLAIGDGANDVAMIQQAHIGVGISGQEGLQAVNASDYAIAQFRFLRSLLLVHGRWNYRRMSKLVCYMFYKNILLVMAQWCYSFFSGYSGQKFYLEVGIQLYNVAFTAVPIIVLGVLDQDVPRGMAELQPEVYALGLRNRHFNDRIFWGWMVSTVWEAAIIFGTSYVACQDLGTKGVDVGMWELGALVFTQVVVCANLRLALHQYRWFWFQALFLVLSILAWAGVAWMVSSVYINTFFQSWDYTQVFPRLLSLPAFWLSVLLGGVSSSFWYFFMKGHKRAFRPDLYHIMQEVYHAHPKDYAAVMEKARVRVASRAVSGEGSVNSTTPNPIHVGGHLSPDRELDASTASLASASDGSVCTTASDYAPSVGRKGSMGSMFSTDETSHHAEAHLAKPPGERAANFRDPLHAASMAMGSPGIGSLLATGPVRRGTGSSASTTSEVHEV
jgi:magnesium-transporting ATPase (P-type)